MRWRLEFYNERRGILAAYGVEASLPAEAVRAGWDAVQAEYPAQPRTGRLGLFDTVARAGSTAPAAGWVLYRIGRMGTNHGHDVVEGADG